MLKKMLRTVIVALGAGAFLGMQAAPSLAAGGPPEKARLKVGIIPISNLTPLYVANKLGYFEEAGLTVETTIASGGAALTGALIGGSLDFIYTNYVSVIQAVSQGFELRVVAHQNSAQNSGRDASAIMVAADGPIRAPADLAGKSIAINALNNINRIAAQYYLEKHGVKGSDVKFVEVPFPNMGDAVVKGQVDGAAMVEPFITFMTNAGKLRPVGYPFIEVAPGLDIAGFVSSAKFVSKNPNTVERFVGALARANAYLNADPERLIALTAEYTKSKPGLIKSLPLDRWSHVVDVKDLQTLSDLSHQYGLQKGPFEVDVLIHETAVK